MAELRSREGGRKGGRSASISSRSALERSPRIFPLSDSRLFVDPHFYSLGRGDMLARNREVCRRSIVALERREEGGEELAPWSISVSSSSDLVLPPPQTKRYLKPSVDLSHVRTQNVEIENVIRRARLLYRAAPFLGNDDATRRRTRHFLPVIPRLSFFALDESSKRESPYPQLHFLKHSSNASLERGHDPFKDAFHHLPSLSALLQPS